MTLTTPIKFNTITVQMSKNRSKTEKNIFLEVEYLGTNYFGFQVQKGKAAFEPTVQGVLEEALEKLFKKKIRIAYAGRTDRGVHANAQAVNFKVSSGIPLKNIKTALNTFLPQDVRINRVKTVPLDFHARFSAKSKIYRYLIYNHKQPSVFLKDFSWHLPEKLDLKAMEKEAKKLFGRRDFSGFAKEAKAYKHCIRDLKTITIKKKGKFVQIDIEADGFLRSMARNIVSFLVGVSDKKNPYRRKPAQACGLYLYRVKY